MRIYEVVAVAGEGGLVNGSKKLSVLLPENSKPVAFIAEPKKRYRFVGWFVNGTFASSNKTITVSPVENFTLHARFELIACRLRVEGRSGVEVYVNDSVYRIPFEVEAPCNSTLLLRYVNGLGGDRTIWLNGSRTVVMSPARLVIEGNASAPIYINGTRYDGFDGYVEMNTVIMVNGSDIPINDTHTWKLVAWKVNNETIYGATFWLVIDGDKTVKPVRTLVKNEYSPIEGEVLTPNGTKKVIVISGAPYMIPAFPFSGTYEYLGNGTYRIIAKPNALVYIALPEGWKEVKIWVLKYEKLDPEIYCLDFYIVTRNDKIYHAIGYGLNKGKYLITFRFNASQGESSFQRYCKVIDSKYPCFKAESGPAEAKPSDTSIGLGWLKIVMANADVVFRIEVIP
ncbi:MAG: hypothetical protein J7K82_04500 [Thermoproteales archaeon]|nr:hypothetical protein [Thermoproteales archaeon]